MVESHDRDWFHVCIKEIKFPHFSRKLHEITQNFEFIEMVEIGIAIISTYVDFSLSTDPLVVHTVLKEIRIWSGVLSFYQRMLYGRTVDSLEAQIKILQMIIIMPVQYQEASIAAHSCLLTPKRKLTLSGCERSVVWIPWWRRDDQGETD